MAKILPPPDPFPGQRPAGWTGSSSTSPDTPAWAIDKEPDNYDYDVPTPSEVTQTITPGNKGSDQGGVLSTNIFPGARGSQPGGGTGAGGASGSGADDVVQTTRPSRSGSAVGNYTQLNAPNFFPGGDQIPSGVADSTGTTGPRRLRADNAGGSMP